MKTIDSIKKGSLSLRCAILGIARSTYYEYGQREKVRYLRDQETVTKLRTLAEAKKFKLGIKGLTMAYSRVFKEPINHKKVARLKREYDIPTKIRTKRFAKPQQPKPTLDMVIPDNIINRQFQVKTPYRFAGTDVTYLGYQNSIGLRTWLMYVTWQRASTSVGMSRLSMTKYSLMVPYLIW